MTDPGRPWLAPLQPAPGCAGAALQAGSTVADALNAARPGGGAAPHLAAGPLRFVPQAALPAGEADEAFMGGFIPTPVVNTVLISVTGATAAVHPWCIAG